MTDPSGFLDPETGEVTLFGEGISACPQPVYSELVAKCPVARMAMIGSKVLSRYEDVVWALHQVEVHTDEADVREGRELRAALD